MRPRYGASAVQWLTAAMNKRRHVFYDQCTVIKKEFAIFDFFWRDVDEPTELDLGISNMHLCRRVCLNNYLNRLHVVKIFSQGLCK